MTDKIHCEDCRFWKSEVPEIPIMSMPPYSRGVCHRNAPQAPVIHPDSKVKMTIYYTAKDEWCGEAEIAEAEGKSR